MIQQQKFRLRQEMKELLQKQRPSKKNLEQLLHQIQTSTAWAQARTVLLFAPLPHEPNLLTLLEKSSHRFFFPRMQGDDLKLHEWSPKANWITGPHNIQEPDPQTWPLASLSEIDLALVPGLAFNKEGKRLGWGRGYFDRLLGDSTCRVIKIGVAWSWQIITTIPSEEHDVTMDFVVTPEKNFSAFANS